MFLQNVLYVSGTMVFFHPEISLPKEAKKIKKNKIKVTSRAGRKEERTAYLCLIPAFLGVSLISYLPTLAVFVLSVFKWNGLSSPEFVGLENTESSVALNSSVPFT